MERMSEEEFINNVEGHITSLKNLDNKALKILVGKLEEENKKLKSDLAFERTMLDNVRAEYKSLQNVNKKLNIKVASLEGEIKGLNSTIERLHKEIEDHQLYEEKLEHRIIEFEELLHGE